MVSENKRFKLGYVCGDFGLIDNDDWIDLHSMSENSEKNVQICINKMNALADENEQLKQECYGNLDGLETYKSLYLDLSEKYSNLEADYDELKDENQRLTNKLNSIALELVDNVVSMGKAIEISEMSYNEFLEYRCKHNKPMELQI